MEIFSHLNSTVVVIVIIITAHLHPTICFAQVTKTWDGDAGTHYWHTDVNWDPAGVPTATDVVETENDSVNIAADVTIQQLYLINAQLHIGAGSALSIDEADYNNDSACELNSGSTVYNHGHLVVNEAQDEGLYICPNCSMINNSGAKVAIVKAGYLYALSSYGSFLNRGHFLISSPTSMGILNSGNLINQARGLIEIDSASRAISNYGHFSNYGEIQLANSKYSGTGLYNFFSTAEFHNYGTMVIDRMEDTGLYLSSEGTFTNHIGGSINLNEIVDTSGEGIHVSNDAQLINHGLIKIDGGTAFGIKASGHITNSDSLLITNIDELGLLLEQDSFINKSTGLIVITDCGETFQVDSSATFQCNGILDIRN